MAKYLVKRGGRWDRLSLDIISDWIIEGMNALDGNKEDIKLTKRSALWIMGHMDAVALEMYCRIVVYSGENGAGKRGMLKNTDGEQFTIPSPTATSEELTIGYGQWLKMDEAEQEEIDGRIIEMNKPPAARHILPVEQLTETEKADPNSKGEGVQTKKG